jgi:hydrogenase nickel incorporation protein HypA/HybF
MTWHRYCIKGHRDTEATMHEITLSQRALEIIEQQAQQAGARRVTGVWLKVGAFSCVEASALTFCFELVCRGTLAEGCELHIAEQQAECWCESCQQYVHLISQHVRRCPQCRATGCRSWRMTAYRFSD